MDQFASEFSIPKTCQSENLPFDNNNKTFSIRQAREHIEFIEMMNHHTSDKQKQNDRVNNFERNNEYLDDDNLDDGGDLNVGDHQTLHSDDDGDAPEREQEYRSDTTVTLMRKLFEKEDYLFNSTYVSLTDKLKKAIESDTLGRFLKEMAEKPNIQTARDHLGRTLLHVAVEKLNIDFVRCLVHAGCNPNAREKCDATPLVIAVILNNRDICQLLVNARASTRGPLFTNIPSPVAIAKKMDLPDLVNILSPTDSDDEDNELQYYDPIFHCERPEIDENASVVDVQYTRKSPGFITGIVGDVGTCKTNRGVMSRSGCHNWVGIIPGDLHAKGYLEEACYKEQGPGGFHCLVQKVMKRSKINKDAFKKKTFAEGNLGRIREAVKDGARAYGLAAVMEFQKSTFFPDLQMLVNCKCSCGDHTKILLSQFKLWIETSSSVNDAFKYRSRMFVYYGPLFELFDLATNNGWGLTRETCYIQQLATYAQLNFRNYFSECFIHILNFLGKWPLSFRRMIQQNCSVNISGKKSHGIELDAFVEAEIVQPLKNYVSGTV